jgi:diguanylate cyclase (GGDEF)-like protein
MINNNFHFDTSGKKDILIIDDTPDNLRVLSSVLRRKGYHVRNALNWHMAFSATLAALPDLILLDIMMPEIDGYEVCKRLKASQQTADIPIIFISALDDVFDKVKAFEVGGVDYISKPFEFEEVLIRVKNQLSLQTARKEILQLNTELEERVKQRTSDLENTLAILHQEISDRQELQNKLLEVALHDSLTGLPNRVLFVKRLEKALSRAKQEVDYKFAVLFLDCDRFKVVNDSLGHSIGDELLQGIAHRLQFSLSPFDTLARLGGDEFAILLENLPNFQTASDIAEKMLQSLSLPFQISQYEVFMNASIGISWGNKNYEKPEYLLRDADNAMYKAKSLGKSRYHVFDPTMYEQAIQLLELENDLRRALERKEFEVYYQPIISLSTGKISGFEALLRWHHPQRGMIFPTNFIPLAEETGLISAIDIWVLKSVCQQLKNWEKSQAIPNNISISVNLSAGIFSQSFLVNEIDQIFEETQVNPLRINIEITESIIMENSDAVHSIVQELKNRSLKLVMDDFGTGYSSLGYLHKFPLYALKIDQSFVSRMLKYEQNLGLVPVMIEIAHSMGVKAIAEGVETKEQLAKLQSLNCDFVQGILFSGAVSSGNVIDLMTSSSQW